MQVFIQLHNKQIAVIFREFLPNQELPMFLQIHAWNFKK